MNTRDNGYKNRVTKQKSKTSSLPFVLLLRRKQKKKYKHSSSTLHIHHAWHSSQTKYIKRKHILDQAPPHATRLGRYRQQLLAQTRQQNDLQRGRVCTVPLNAMLLIPKRVLATHISLYLPLAFSFPCTNAKAPPKTQFLYCCARSCQVK